MGTFDDLIPGGMSAASPFADLVPGGGAYDDPPLNVGAAPGGGPFDDLIPTGGPQQPRLQNPPPPRRLSLFPYPVGALKGQPSPVDWSNWIAPEWLMELKRAAMLPGQVLKGPVSDRAITGMTAALMGGAALGGRAAGGLGMNVWHGGPTKWAAEPGFPQGRPRLDKMGTGEGAQAYGHGFYTAEAKGVGESYQGLGRLKEWDVVPAEGGGFNLYGRPRGAWEKKNLGTFKTSDAAEEAASKMSGSLKKLDLPDEDIAKFLDWDAPLSKQPESVRKILADNWMAHPDTHANQTGQQIYNSIANNEALKMGGGGVDLDVARKAASEALRKAGIPGLKYYDQMSRTGGKGTRNYVIWDQDVLNRTKILEHN